MSFNTHCGLGHNPWIPAKQPVNAPEASSLPRKGIGIGIPTTDAIRALFTKGLKEIPKSRYPGDAAPLAFLNELTKKFVLSFGLLSKKGTLGSVEKKQMADIAKTLHSRLEIELGTFSKKRLLTPLVVFDARNTFKVLSQLMANQLPKSNFEGRLPGNWSDDKHKVPLNQFWNIR
jgi:hypothetical protein